MPSNEIVTSLDVALLTREAQRILVATVDALRFIYVGTWANRPLVGLSARQRAFFTDVGVSGSEWIWDGAYWVPAYPVVLARGAGTVAAPLATLAGVVSGVFVTAGTLPAGMFVKPGMTLEAATDVLRVTGVAASRVILKVGTAQIINRSNAATADGGIRLQSNMYAVTANTQMVQGNAGINAVTAGAFTDTAADCTAAQSLTVELSNADVSDSFKLLSYSFTIFP